MALLVSREGVGVEHVRADLPALPDWFAVCLVPDGVHVVFDGGCLVCAMARGGKGDLVRGLGFVAAVNEFSVDGLVWVIDR